VFGPKRDEVTGEWRKLHELNDLYSSPNIVWVILLRRTIWLVQVTRMVESISIYRALVGKREGKSRLRGYSCRREDNIKMDLQGVGCGCIDWMDLAQDSDR
jgi:hypothetical protein